MPTSLKQLAAQTLSSGGTAQALTGTVTVCQAILITADTGNAGTVYIGDADVDSTNGIPVAAGASVRITGPQLGKGGADDMDLSEIYWDGTTSDTIRISYQQKQDP